MRFLFAKATLLILASIRLDAQTIPANTLADIRWRETRMVNFVADRSLIDGPMMAFTLSLNGGAYDGVLIHKRVDRATGEVSTIERNIGFGLACKTLPEAKVAICRVDKRLADGALTVIEIRLNSEGLYDVATTATYIDQHTGGDVTKRDLLVANATLSWSIPLHKI